MTDSVIITSKQKFSLNMFHNKMKNENRKTQTIFAKTNQQKIEYKF